MTTSLKRNWDTWEDAYMAAEARAFRRARENPSVLLRLAGWMLAHVLRVLTQGIVLGPGIFLLMLVGTGQADSLPTLYQALERYGGMVTVIGIWAAALLVTVLHMRSWHVFGADPLAKAVERDMREWRHHNPPPELPISGTSRPIERHSETA